jgi:hypothetical protein
MAPLRRCRFRHGSGLVPHILRRSKNAAGMDPNERQ